MKNKIIIMLSLLIITLIVIFIIIVLESNKEKDISITVGRFGVYDVYFYDINSEEIINYKKK